MYIVVLLILIGLFGKKLNRQTVIVIITCVLSFLWGLRYDVGIDYKSYELIFKYNLNYGEIGYKMLEFLARKINGQFYILTTLVAFLTHIFLGITLYKSKISNKYLKLGYIIYYLSGISLMYANLMRQGIAVTLSYLMVYYYKFKNDKIKVVSLLFLGMLFHKSILIFFILFFCIEKLTISNKKLLLIVWGSYIFKFLISYNLIIFTFLKLLNILYKGYSYERIKFFALKSNPKDINLGILILMIILSIFLLINTRQKKSDLYTKLFATSIVFKIFASHNYIFNRIGLYFDIYLIPFIIFSLLKTRNKKTKKIIQIIIFSMLFGVFLKNGYFSGPKSKYAYKHIFNNF